MWPTNPSSSEIKTYFNTKISTQIFTAALFTIPQTGNIPNTPLLEMDTHAAGHQYDGLLLSHEINYWYTTKWINLRCTYDNWKKPDSKAAIHCMISFLCVRNEGELARVHLPGFRGPITTSQNESKSQVFHHLLWWYKKEARPEKVPASHSSVFSQGPTYYSKIRWISKDVGVVSLSREPPTKGSCSFLILGPGQGRGGRTRSGKVLSTKS